jgi:hypothetical protein
MTKSFTLNGNIDLLSKYMFNGIKERYENVVYSDKADFCGEESRCQIDTYQVYSFFERGYITINLYFFKKSFEDSSILVKVSIFSPVKDKSIKGEKILKEIEQLLLHYK